MKEILTPGCTITTLEETKAIKATLDRATLPNELQKAADLFKLTGNNGVEVHIEPAKELNSLKIEEDRITIRCTNEETRMLALGYLNQLKTLYRNRLPLIELNYPDPQTPYRGIHLDCARHFFGIEEIKRLLIMFASLGFNHFHWHLTDDQGWRFSVPGYPLIDTISSTRPDTGYLDEKMRIEGLYSRAEMTEMVKFADSLGITIIPEIEFPGHASALVAAYPEFGCTGKKIEVPTTWGVFYDILNPASPAVWQFIDAAIKEIASLFPGPYIHIGGDECPHDQWEENEGCQALMAEHKLKNTMALQGWFTSRVARIVAKYQKRAIGWDEIIEAPELDESVIIMSWRGLEGARKATAKGHQVILCPEADGGCYFDRYQSTEPWEAGNLSISPLKQVFRLDFAMKELPPKERELILGGQGCMWTEKLPFGRAVEYMYFPRVFALAENLWRGDNRKWEDFIERRDNIFRYLTDSDICFCPTPWEING